MKMGLKKASAMTLRKKILPYSALFQSPAAEKSYEDVELTDLFNFDNNMPTKFDEDIFNQDKPEEL